MRAPDKKRGEETAAPPKRVLHGFPVRLSSRRVGSVRADKTFAYSEDDWKDIRVSLARVGIDADAVTVGDRWWARLDPTAALTAEPRRLLRQQLQELAADYRGLEAHRKQGHSLTPLQEAAEIREALDKLEAARATLDLRTLSFSPHTEGAREALTPLIAQAKRHRDRLIAEGSRSRMNARKAHIEYWGELVRLWRAIVADQNRRQRERRLNAFLLACSAPAFPEATSKSRIEDFCKKRGKRT